MAKSQIRVLCVEDHRIVRDGIVLILEQQRDLVVVATAESGEDAVREFVTHRPDITLMDLHLRGMSGSQAIREIRDIDPQARIIALTMYYGDEDISRVLRAGAAAYVLKDTLADDLINVIRQVHAGQRPIPASVEERLAMRAKTAPLTPREVEVVELLAAGLRNKEIGARLSLSELTVGAHVKSIFAKLNVHDRTAALAVAIRRGIIHIQ